MTTHDQPTDVAPTSRHLPAPGAGDEALDPSIAQGDWTAEDQDREPTMLQERDVVDEGREPASPGAKPTNEAAELIAADQLAGLRAQWDHVQASFVDDPRECVQKADGLVTDVVEQLTNGFAAARARLEEQWARGQDASTEDLRVALKRYREFFDRLLSV